MNLELINPKLGLLTICRTLFSLLALAVFARQALAQATSQVVATTEIQIKDEKRDRSLMAVLWSEADTGVAAESITLLPPLKAIEFARGGASKAQSGKKPLIIISHGNWSTPYAHASLAIDLVRAGYLVMSPSHPGTMNGDLRTDMRLRLWERPQDISIALDAVLTNPQWAARVDESRIGFVGHSFGAFTGVSLAGGIYSIADQLKACEGVKDQYCEGMIRDYTPALKTDDSTRSYQDKRIKAFYLLAGGPGLGFSVESLKQIKQPIVFETAQFDTVLAPAAGSSYLAKQIPTASEVVRPIGHFSYAPLCRPIIGKALAGQICADPEGVDRSNVHAQMSASARGFFSQQLK